MSIAMKASVMSMNQTINASSNYKYSRVIIPYVLRLYSTISRIHYFSFGEYIEDYLFNNTPCRYELFFDIKSKDYFIKNLKNKQFEYIYSDSLFVTPRKERIELLYMKKLGLINIYAYALLSDRYILLFVSKLYYDVFRFRIENVLPPGIHLRDLTYIKLVLSNYIPFHASAFAINDEEGYLILAPPNTGKSFIITQLAKMGFKVLSEDITVVNGTSLEMYAVPYTSTMYHELSKLKYLAPFSYYLSPRLIAFGRMFKDRLIPKAKLKGIIILERGSRRVVRNISKETIVIRVVGLTRSEFAIRSNIIANAILYFLEKDIENIEYERISRIIDNADAMILRAKKPQEYIKMIGEVLGKK